MLVDSRAVHSFIDADMAQALGILLHQKMDPNLLETIDGSLMPSGPVTLETVPLEVVIQNHTEILWFRVISSSHFLIILSILWMAAHNLHVLSCGWKVSFRFEFCHLPVWLHLCHVRARAGRSAILSLGESG